MTSSLALPSLSALTLTSKQQQRHSREKQPSTDQFSNSDQHTHEIRDRIHSARIKLQTHRTNIDDYVARQKTLIDATQAQKASLYQQEKNRLNSIKLELQKIQRQRGILGDEDNKENSISGIIGGRRDNKDGIAQQREKMQRRQTEVEGELANLHLEGKDVQKKFNATKEKEKAIFTKAEKVRKSKERVENSKKVTIEDLTIAVLKYQELGLDFVKGESSSSQTLRFNFTMIDPQDHDRLFWFALQIDHETDNYFVEECEPELEPKIVMPLLEELNKDVEFAAFIRSMRSAFKDLVDFD